MNFKDYLNEQINQPKPEWFNPDGNSQLATIMRGKIGTLKYEFKRLLPSIRSDLVYFWDGIDTPIGYFLQILILPLLLPFLPFIRAWHSYRSAIKCYKENYTKSKGGKK